MKSFFMRSSTIRLGIFISTLVIATILVFQLVWLKRVYRFEQKEFDHSVTKAIRGLYEDLNDLGWNAGHLSDLVENPEPQLYIARLKLPVNPDTLLSYLHYELEDFDVFTDCHIGLYNAGTSDYIFKGVLQVTAGKDHSPSQVPLIKRSYDHVALYFPNRKKYILSRMNFWVVSSIILLLVLLLFGASVYYFYRQKFLNEVQRDFLHHFTHEFKTPVSVISLAADVLKDPGISQKPEKLTTYAGIVDYQASYLNNQIEKLLKFASLESHQLNLQKEPTDLHELVNESIVQLDPLIQEKSATIHLALHASKSVLLADRDYLLIVITNLVDNALKYARNPVIHISTENQPGWLLLTVKDNGIGIAKKDRAKLFKKFSRIQQGETYSAKGFGLGLVFVKRIINAHAGRIEVASEPGIGSSFSIRLPNDKS